MSNKGIQVYSEIGQLKKVLLHRPGEEIENLTPELMERLLFDDIPFLEVAREEHDAFAEVFRNNGVEVVYLEELMAETLDRSNVKEMFIDQFIEEADILGEHRREEVKTYFMNFDDHKKLVDKMMAGIRKDEFEDHSSESLSDMAESEYPFIVDPMPNLYFTRDPFASIGSGITLHKMRTKTRRRETIFASYIFKYHPEYKDVDIPFWYDRNEDYSIEGGDIAVLSDKVIAIGISERTDAAAIDEVAKSIFAKKESFETILAFDIPKTRAFMHLDTVFTMVDYDKFTIHPEIEGPLTVYSIKKGKEEGELDIEKETKELDQVLAQYLGVDEVTLIRCGGGPGIDAAREQWNDGSNTLSIAPGEVIVYSRNHVTNQLLTEAGVKLHIIPSSELSRGRGGPRCMSMPLWREKL